MENKGSKNLGKGLSAFFGDVASYDKIISKDQPTASDSKNTVVWIALGDIEADLNQPRKGFNEEKILELAESIRENGLIQPILLKYVTTGDKKYKIVAGERRYKACKILNLETIPAIIRTLSDSESRKISIIENVQRVDLNAIEEALSYNTLVKEFEYSIDDISRTIGKSRSHIVNTMRLLKLNEYVQDALFMGNITQGHARALIGVDNQSSICDKIIRDGLSVRSVEKIVSNIKKPIDTNQHEMYEMMGNVISSITEDNIADNIETDIIDIISKMVFEDYGVKLEFNEDEEDNKFITSSLDQKEFAKIIIYMAKKFLALSKRSR